MADPILEINENQRERKRAIDQIEYNMSGPLDLNFDQKDNIHIKKSRVYAEIAAEVYQGEGAGAGLNIDIVDALHQINNNMNNNFNNLRTELNECVQSIRDNSQQTTTSINQLINFTREITLIQHINTVKLANSNYRAQNQNKFLDDIFSPILKEIVGNGQFPWMGHIDNPIHGLIGQSHPNFPQNQSDALGNVDIDSLAFFYNEDFGIILGDPLHTKRVKFQAWVSRPTPIQLLLPYTEEPLQPLQPPQPPQPLQKAMIKMVAKQPPQPLQPLQLKMVDKQPPQQPPAN